MNSSKLNILDRNITDSIPEYFSNKNVLITGATGFMGKVLLEKLLRDCPDIGTLYLLMRPGKNLSVKEKLENIVKNPLFDSLWKKNPEALAKLRIVNGDLLKINLGLSDNDRKDIIENVNIVYHGAASVRLNMPLQEAIMLNVRGTREVCKMVLEIKNVITFLHVSTAFCHVEKDVNDVIDEIIYPPKGSWREAIELAENWDQNLLKIIQAKYIGNSPNSYTYAKSLSENLVVDMCEGKVQTIILRPTIVMPAYKGPIPGWTDNFNGPIGVMLGMNVGVIRAIELNGNVSYDYIPVDETINSMIKAVWMQQYLDPDKISVYNSSCHNVYEVTCGKLLEIGKASMEPIILKPFWHANLYTSSSKLMVYLHIVLFHVLPLALLDLGLKIQGKKTKFVRLQRKVYLAIMAYQYFLLNSWTFLNNKCLDLDNYLSDGDKEMFCNNLEDINYQDYFFTMAHTARIFILKEDPKNQHIYKRTRIIYRCIHVALKYLLISLFSWIAYRLLFVNYEYDLIPNYE